MGTGWSLSESRYDSTKAIMQKFGSSHLTELRHDIYLTKVCGKCFREKIALPCGIWTCRPCHNEQQKIYNKEHPLKRKPLTQEQKEKSREYLHKYNHTIRKTNKESDGRRFTYKGRTIRGNLLRTGVCNLCRAVRGFDCKFTNYHHTVYDDNNPEAGVIELCRKCHNKESLEMGHIVRNPKNGRFV